MQAWRSLRKQHHLVAWRIGTATSVITCPAASLAGGSILLETVATLLEMLMPSEDVDRFTQAL